MLNVLMLTAGGRTPVNPGDPAGPWEINQDVWLFHPYGGHYEQLPVVLSHARYGHSCGVATENNAIHPRRVVHISGGIDDTGLDRMDSVTIDPLDDIPSFSNGPSLPRPMSYATTAQLIRDFVLVGGQTGQIALDTFTRFDVNSGLYSELAEKLATPRMALAASPIYNDNLESTCTFTKV